MILKYELYINTPTLVEELKQCARKKDLRRGKQLHLAAVQSGSDKDLYVSNTLIQMYIKCGDMTQARRVFDEMSHKTAVSWNALTQGYVENGEFFLALHLLDTMDCAPNPVTFVVALKACTRLVASNRMEKEACLCNGERLRTRIRELGFEENIFVSTALVDMYSKCGEMKSSRLMFDGMTERNVVSWTALIVGYVENGQSSLALRMFDAMDCAKDPFTYAAALRACKELAVENKLEKKIFLEKGLAMHKQAHELGFDKDIVVASALVDMYSKCGDMRNARSVFENMSHRNVVTWTALVCGYVDNGQSLEALETFTCMDCRVDRLALVAALKACANTGSVSHGQRIHYQACELGWEQDEMVGTTLVDFYGKCGKMHAAEGVFDRMHSRNTVTWTALIGGYSSLGDTSEVFHLVETMQECEVKVNSVTVQLVLTACSHAGLLEKGRRYFESMSRYGLSPTLEHYGCMVDMLGRVNRLEEALRLVREMPFKGDSVIWTALMWGCRKWNNLEIGKVAFDELVKFREEGSVAVAHVLMRNIYERLGMHQECKAFEREMEVMRLWRRPSRTWWWCDGGVRSFVIGDWVDKSVTEMLKSITTYESF